jgi:glycosyltransferase involved in cell wall biosynthesis
MTPWLLVAGDLTPLGGMDAANHALARHLAHRGDEVHVVTHRAWPDLRSLPSLNVHEVWRPFGRHMLGGPMLAREGRRVWRRLRVRGARAVANGGNCRMTAANWVHYVHAAFRPDVAGTVGQRAKWWLAHRRELAAEREALCEARVVICNSQRTARDVIERIGVDSKRVVVVYYGSDVRRFGPVTDMVRDEARRQLNVRDNRPLVGFVGALSDRRKAFDTVFRAQTSLCRRPDWDAQLVVVGAGAELPAWRRRAAEAGLQNRIVFMGFRPDVPDILAGLDVLVHPARYEAYGLSVHEAICRGLPALVSSSAGVAERYPEALRELLIDDPNDDRELAERLWQWRSRRDIYSTLVAPFAATLRARSWDAMAEEIAHHVERAA